MKRGIWNVTNGNGQELGRFETEEEAIRAARKEAMKHKQGAFMIWMMTGAVQSDMPNEFIPVN